MFRKPGFQVIGAPQATAGDFTFTPTSMPGAKNPPNEGLLCRGYDLSQLPVENLRKRTQLDLSYLLDAYQNYPDKAHFFLENGFFDKLAGSPILRQQIIAGKSEAEIREAWREGLEAFRQIRSKYLIYHD